SGCDPSEPAGGGGSTTPAYERVAEDNEPDPGERPVTIGELGPNFPACYAMARFRDRIVAEDAAIPVRAAPFDQARQTARLAASAQFFICTRTHDQRWFAVVWDEAEGASRRCGVSQPVSARRDYSGPCRSGWIPSALVRLESGILHRDAPAPNSSN
ncbi:MAG TPA: hypothetical protein VF577_05865, partial [Allosphingosinicella sp.]